MCCDLFKNVFCYRKNIDQLHFWSKKVLMQKGIQKRLDDIENPVTHYYLTRWFTDLYVFFTVWSAVLSKFSFLFSCLSWTISLNIYYFKFYKTAYLTIHMYFLWLVSLPWIWLFHWVIKIVRGMKSNRSKSILLLAKWSGSFGISKGVEKVT